VAIRSFDVGTLRGLRRAAAEELPNLVAISGPNGAGKSSLLERLNSQKPAEAGTEIMYVGAHRTWRSNPINEVVVYGMTLDFGDILKQESMPGLPYAIGNLNAFNGHRRIGSNGDDAQAYVKASIVRIRNKKQRLLTRNYDDQGQQIKAGTVPDLFGPFRELVDTLLPHLEWVGVNDTNTNDIKCEFRPTDNPNVEPFDIDELSSGEKAAIALFLPFIERQVADLAGESKPQPAGIVPVTFLIDEPELHLHALLQLNVLEYMRRLAHDGRVQFIFTVHSPSLLDALTQDELFLLTPASMAADNQLSRLVETSERLEAVRAATGSTHVLTRCKPIVFVEGEASAGARVSDERLMKVLLPEIAHWAIVPSHGKSQVIRAVTDMRNSELNLPGVPVFGIVDNDQGKVELPDFVMSWPVAMMENLLLDPVAIEQLARIHSASGVPTSQVAIERSLRDIAALQLDYERRLRIKELLPRITYSIDSVDPDAIAASLEANLAAFREKINGIDLAAKQEEIEAEVRSIIDNREELERFHGKQLLRSWYNKYFANSAIGWRPFLLELARYAGSTERTARLTGGTIARVKLYFPDQLVPTLERCGASETREALLTECKRERELWERAKPESPGRESLRQRLMQYAREAVSDEADKSAIMDHAMMIGTR
jgi:predicted ATPase